MITFNVGITTIDLFNRHRAILKRTPYYQKKQGKFEMLDGKIPYIQGTSSFLWVKHSTKTPSSILSSGVLRIDDKRLQFQARRNTIEKIKTIFGSAYLEWVNFQDDLVMEIPFSQVKSVEYYPLDMPKSGVWYLDRNYREPVDHIRVQTKQEGLSGDFLMHAGSPNEAKKISFFKVLNASKTFGEIKQKMVQENSDLYDLLIEKIQSN